jgi:ABC-2 type transport system ATP-binding protein
MLELISVSKRYGDVVALADLDLGVEPGQVFGFVGTNGAGKTTAMRIVIGLLAADAGEVRWDGGPITRAQRRRIGYMPEERGLYPKMRVGDQLRYFGRLHGLSEADARAACEEWMARLGVADRADDAVETLSLGNQQRVQLGVALVAKPDLLVLDEPFSGLDPTGVDVLSGVLADEARARGVPVIFSSHQLELVERLCDAVAIIARGRLVASGRVAELRERRAGNLWQIEVDGAPAGWVDGLPGIRATAQPGIYDLDPGADPQALLDAGRRAGAVLRFGRRLPTLADLFREAVEAS